MEPLSTSSSYLRIGCWNVQGLQSKSQDKTIDVELLNAIDECTIVGLTETHTVEGGPMPQAIGNFEAHYFH